MQQKASVIIYDENIFRQVCAEEGYNSHSTDQMVELVTDPLADFQSILLDAVPCERDKFFHNYRRKFEPAAAA